MSGKKQEKKSGNFEMNDKWQPCSSTTLNKTIFISFSQND